MAYTMSLEELTARTAIQGIAALAAELRGAGVLDMQASDRVGQAMLNFIENGKSIDGAEHMGGWIRMLLISHS